MTEYDAKRPGRILHLWIKTDMTQTEIAIATRSSPSYVNKLVRGVERDLGALKWVPKKVTTKQVLETYFLYPELLTPHEIAKKLEADPEQIIAVCKTRGLPFPGKTI